MASKYRQLAGMLKQKMESSDEEPVKLPAERELAVIYGVSRQTVRRAIALLAEEGVIEKRRGSGNYAHREASAWQKRIAVITPAEKEALFSPMYRDIQNICIASGCSVQIFSTANRVSREREILLSLLEHPVSGICVEGSISALPNPNLDLYRHLRNTGVSVVFLNGGYPGLEDTVSVSMDNQAGGYLAVRHLMERNHTRIAFLFSSDSLQGRERYQGCISAVRDYGLPILDECYFWYDSRQYCAGKEAGGNRFLGQIADSLREKCSAVICQNDEIAFLLLRALQARGCMVPQEMSVLCFEESYYSEAGRVPLSVLASLDGRIGTVAAEKLLRMIGRSPESSVRLNWRLVEKGSVSYLG